MNCFQKKVLLTTLSLCLAASPALAELVTFTFAGEIVRLDGNVGFLGGTIPVGTPFSGSYTFESTTPDIRPTEPRLGNYEDALTALSLDVGSYHLSGLTGAVNGIRVANDLNGFDSYIAGDDSTPLLGRPVEIGVIFGDYQASAFLNDSLPVVAFPLEPFEDRIMQIGSSSGQFYVVGEISHFVPEPGTVFLLVPSFAAFLRRHRNNTQQGARFCSAVPRLMT